MPTIAIVGAGPGLGLSIATVFGRQGFDVALIARNATKLDKLVAQLADRDITAAGFVADIADHTRLATALDDARQRFGSIDVLEFSPHAGLTMLSPQDVTVDNLRPEIESTLYGAVTAVRTVLPDMLATGSGTLIFTTGGGAVDPYPQLATINTAQAALRNWAVNLHNTLTEQGVYAVTVAINLMIGEQAPPGVPHRSPDEIAEQYWGLYTERVRAHHFIGE